MRVCPLSFFKQTRHQARPKNPKTFFLRQNYVALISPSHLKIRRSKMKLLSSTIIKNPKSFLAPQWYKKQQKHSNSQKLQKYSFITNLDPRSSDRSFYFSFLIKFQINSNSTSSLYFFNIKNTNKLISPLGFLF